MTKPPLPVVPTTWLRRLARPVWRRLWFRIEARLRPIESRVGELEVVEGRLRPLESRVGELETVEGRLRPLEARVGELEVVEGRLRPLESRVGELEAVEAPPDPLPEVRGLLDEKLSPVLARAHAQEDLLARSRGEQATTVDQLRRVELSLAELSPRLDSNTRELQRLSQARGEQSDHIETVERALERLTSGEVAPLHEALRTLREDDLPQLGRAVEALRSGDLARLDASVSAVRDQVAGLGAGLGRLNELPEHVGRIEHTVDQLLAAERARVSSQTLSHRLSRIEAVIADRDRTADLLRYRVEAVEGGWSDARTALAERAATADADHQTRIVRLDEQARGLDALGRSAALRVERQEALVGGLDGRVAEIESLPGRVAASEAEMRGVLGRLELRAAELNDQLRTVQLQISAVGDRAGQSARIVTLGLADRAAETGAKINYCLGGPPLPGHVNVDKALRPGIDIVADIGVPLPFPPRFLAGVFISGNLSASAELVLDQTAIAAWRALLASGGRIRFSGVNLDVALSALAEGRLTQPQFTGLMARSGGEGGFRPTLSSERLARFLSDAGFGHIEWEPVDSFGDGYTYRVEGRVD